MPSDAVAASAHKLPLFKTVGEIWTLLRSDWRQLLQVILIPVVILALSCAMLQNEIRKFEAAKNAAAATRAVSPVGGAPAVVTPAPAATPEFKLNANELWLLAGLWLAIGLSHIVVQIKGLRYLLLGETRNPSIFGRREWLYMGYNLLYVLAITGGVMAAVLIGLALSTVLRAAGLNGLAVAISVIIGMVILVFITMRLLLTFPAIAIDNPTPMTTARAISKQQVLSMSGILFLVNLPLFIINVLLAVIVALVLQNSAATIAIAFTINCIFSVVGVLVYLTTLAVFAYRLNLPGIASEPPQPVSGDIIA